MKDGCQNGTRRPTRREALRAAALLPLLMPGAAAGGAAWQNGAGDRLRGRRFLSDLSPWNRRVSDRARLRPVAGIGSAEAGLTSWSDAAASVAIHFAKPADPLVPVLFHPDTWRGVADGKWRRTGNPAAVEHEILRDARSRLEFPANPYSTQVAGRTWNGVPSGLPSSYRRAETDAPVRARVPREAEPATDWDGHTAIVQPDGRALELYAPIRLSSGEWVSQMYSFTDAACDLGIGWENGRRASMIQNYAGVLRMLDLERGRIDHALAILAPARFLRPAFEPPALAFDSDSSDYRGVLPMGAQLVLPRNRAPATHTVLGSMLAEAARVYGMILVDRGGGGFSIVTERSAEFARVTSRTPALQNDLQEIMRHAVALAPLETPRSVKAQ